MIKLIRYFRKNIGTLYRILLFIASILIIINIFPKKSKFRFEFQKGSPWKHEDLIAPYDFAVYKLESEIQEEKDSLLMQFKPYFAFKKEVSERQLISFKNNYLNALAELKNANMVVADKASGKLNEKRLNTIFSNVFNLIEEKYNTGIIESHDFFQGNPDNHNSVVIIKENIAEEYEENDIFTSQTAYNSIMDELNKLRNENKVSALEINFVLNLNINLYIEPNIVYDEHTSKKVKESLISNISLTRGMVQMGERIIYKGEVVDDEKFRILESLKKEFEKTNSVTNQGFIFAGNFLMIFTAFLILFLFLLNFRRDILENTSKTTFILFMVVTMTACAALIVRYNLFNIYLFPFALIPIIIKTFYDSRLALFVHMITIFIVGFIVPNGFEFLWLQFSAGVFAIFSLNALYRRVQLYTTSAFVIFAYSLVYFCLALMQEGDIAKIQWIYFGYFGLNGLLLLISYPLIYGFERIFGFLSDVSLLELSDTNQPLLRKLAQQAPGTFQHSLQVANLAEEAIHKIGGNSLLVRTGALYHDIGKLVSPIFYIENQVAGINPHENLDFEESAEIIINHVEKGVELAEKARLPQQVIDFIVTHHGNTKVQFFYQSFIKKYPDAEVNEKKFSYLGPKPFSKETAVLMMADSVEAASRSLKTYTSESIDNLVESVINFQISQDLFTNAPVTFRDITQVKRLFKEKLKNIYHTRIEYPKTTRN